MKNSYHFVTDWRFRAEGEVVYDIASDPFECPRWWSTVYLYVEALVHGAEEGLGCRLHRHTKGWLPYELRWEALTTGVLRPRGSPFECVATSRARNLDD